MIKKSLLPKEYQEVEYIQSSGTQYIDTGVYLSDTTGMEVTAEVVTSSDSLLFGAYRYMSLGSNNYGLYYSWYQGNWTGTTYRPNVQNQKFKASINYYNSREATYNDVANPNYITNYATITTPCEYTAVLFGWRRTTTGGVYYLTQAKVYNCKITDGTTIVRDFIPCYRKSDNEIGMYDIINGVFYTNQGDGTFIKGNDVTNEVLRIHKTLLPNEYQEVEYIESTGTQYIDMNYKANQNTRVLVKAQVPSSATISNGYRLLGARVANNNNGFFVSTYNNNFHFNYGNQTASTTIDLSTFKDAFELDFNKNKVYLDGQLKYEFNNETFENTVNSVLFGGNQNGTVASKAWKIYSCTVYNNNILIRDLKPCYRKSDNVMGMYDVVNDVFYTNAGSGSFTKGKNILFNNNIIKVYYGTNIVFYGLPSAYQRVEYIQSDGNQYINTNYAPNNNTKIQYTFMPLAATSTTMMFGCWGNTTTAGRMCIYVNNTKLQYGFGKGAGASGTNYKDFTDNVVLNSKYDLIMDKTSCYSNGELVVSGLSGTNEGNTQKFWIGKCNDLNNRNTNPTKIYECSIWDNNVLQKKFIPCYRKSDNEIGMYDLVNGVFYTNQGTGTFVKGVNI